MTTAELEEASSAFGLRPAPRMAMVEELERLWHTYTEALCLARARTKHDAPCIGAAPRPRAPHAGGDPVPDPRASWPRVTSADELRVLARAWLMADTQLYERVLTFETVDLAHVTARLEAAADNARVRVRLSKPVVTALLDGWGVTHQCRWRAVGAC